MPLISVVMSVFNDDHYVRHAIESVLSQTFTDFEFIIVDDGCTDNTRAIIEAYSDKRIRLVINENNIGLAPSLNKAIRLSNAKYVARQDADDISLSERLSREVEYLETHSDVALVGSSAVRISHSGEWIGYWNAIAEDIDLKWTLLFCNPFIHSSIMMRRSVADQVGCYTERPEVAKAFVEDYDLWSRINRISRSANLRQPLLKYRLNPTSVSVRTCDDQIEQANRISLRNISWLLNRDVTLGEERQALEDANLLFYSPDGRDPQLPPPRLRSAVTFFGELQRAFYCRYSFSPSAISAHKRHWHWIWGRHLLALSLRCPAGIGNRLTLAALASRYMQGVVSSLTTASVTRVGRA